MTLSEENYLKSIYHLEKTYSTGVSTSAIAEFLDTKASSVTDMVQRLADKNLLSYKPYRGVTLLEAGRKHAVLVIRRHRLWECFLVDKLNFSWDEVHAIAEELEHIQSQKLIDRLDQFLGFPKVDPHGDSIPDKEGKFTTIQKYLISECVEGAAGVFVGVKDSSPEFLQYLDKQSIALGDLIQIIHRESFDQSVEIVVHNKTVVVSNKTASNIYLRPKAKK